MASTITTFIVYIQPQLQPDPGEETVALLRVILYNMNNTAFEGKVPTLPDWKGAPVLLCVSQIILYCCLAGALLSGWYLVMVMFFTDQYSLGWRNRFLDWLTRWVFILMYMLVAGAVFGTFLALVLQVPFFSSTATIHSGPLGKGHVQ